MLSRRGRSRSFIARQPGRLRDASTRPSLKADLALFAGYWIAGQAAVRLTSPSLSTKKQCRGNIHLLSPRRNPSPLAALSPLKTTLYDDRIVRVTDRGSLYVEVRARFFPGQAPVNAGRRRVRAGTGECASSS
jgi:hypothetical protein